MLRSRSAAWGWDGGGMERDLSSQIRDRLLPSLRSYNPDLILLSMGFDGAGGDVGNINIYLDSHPAGLDLRTEDYEWATEQVGLVADMCCDGRIVSVLEGGYGARERKAGPTGVYSLNRDILATCACAHLRALVGYDVKVAQRS
uniref:histone deacetylase n=2 Tax=Hemiselmis andersenii TaxID=464988 RepID=A0A7S1H9X0_HEMAN|mmetsp:Transcript_47083/g.114436  ORF Transcript_47083/g.114436 Transcript_47083/m.114436 type:complete len:144 (+) Transcript_47083:116-547(+)